MMMNNQKLVAGLDMMMAGLELMKASVLDGEVSTSEKLTAGEEVVAGVKTENKKSKSKKIEAPVVEVVEEEIPEEVEAEEVSEDAVTHEELTQIDIQGLKELAKLLKVTLAKNDKIDAIATKILAVDMEVIVAGLTELGYYEDDSDVGAEVEEAEEEAESEEENETMAMLEAMSVEELADALEEAGLTKTGKKQALVDRVFKAIESGEIVLDTDGTESEEESEESEEESEEEEELTVESVIEELDDEQIKELATALEIPLTMNKKIGGKVKKVDFSIEALKGSIIEHEGAEEALVTLGYVAGDEESEEVEESEEIEEVDGEVDGEEFEASEERVEAEDKLEATIRAQYKAKKLKDSDIEKFNKAMFVGDPDCGKGCKGCDKESALDCYIDQKKNFIDDEGVTQKTETPYERNGTYFCCGKELITDADGDPACGVCGAVYSEEE